MTLSRQFLPSHRASLIQHSGRFDRMRSNTGSGCRVDDRRVEAVSLAYLVHREALRVLQLFAFRIPLYFSCFIDTFPLCGYHAHTLACLRRLPLPSKKKKNLGVSFLEYYGGSVALRLSSGRRSRFCAEKTCSVFRCPFVLFRVHYPPSIGGSIDDEDWGLMFFRCRSFRHDLADASYHHARTWV